MVKYSITTPTLRMIASQKVTGLPAGFFRIIRSRKISTWRPLTVPVRLMKMPMLLTTPTKAERSLTKRFQIFSV